MGDQQPPDVPPVVPPPIEPFAVPSKPLVSTTRQHRSHGGRWKKVWKGIVRVAKSKWPGLSTAFGLGCSLTFFLMQAYYVPSQVLSLHDDNVELKKTNRELIDGIATKDQKIRDLTIPEPQPLSWHEIEEGFAKRAGRGAEQVRFSQEYVGKEVDWEVSLASPLSRGWSFYYSENDSSYNPQALFGARFVAGSPAKDLKPGDRIKVHGTLAIFSGAELEIRETTYQFLAPAPKSE